MNQQNNDPLHGVTLKQILTELVYNCGWSELAFQIKINCFQSDPSISSSLKFLRRTPWARSKVEQLYLDMIATEDFKRGAEIETEDENEDN